jgi:drug/metabolite transporter (DMT)-like permease
MKSHTMLAYFYCFCSAALFSTLEVAGKLLSPGINPYVTTVDRFLIGALFLAPFALRNRPRGLGWRDYLRLTAPGVLNVSISMVLLQIAVYHGKASLVALLISCNPLFVAIFAPMILKEKLDWPQLTGLTVGLTGLGLIIYAAGGFTAHGANTLTVVFALSAAAIFGFYSVICRPLVKRYGNLYFNFVSFLAGSLVLAIYCRIVGIGLPLPACTTDWLLLLYMGALVTGLNYYLFFLGQSRVPTLAASLILFLKPAMAVLLTSAVLNDRITVLQGVSIAIVAVGVNIKPLLSLRTELKERIASR